MVHRRGDKDSSDVAAADSSQSDEEWKKNLRVSKMSRFGGVVCFLALFLALTTASSKTTRTELGSAKSDESLRNIQTTAPTSILRQNPVATATNANFMAEYMAFEKAFEKYDNCVVSYVPPPPKTQWDTKPLWLPAFPGSGTTGPTGKGDIFKPLINTMVSLQEKFVSCILGFVFDAHIARLPPILLALLHHNFIQTGLRAGAKFYHASSKILKRCKGIDESVTCANGHPVVDIGPGKQKDNFYHKVIMVVRNFKTAYPTHDSEKGEAYHDKTGQNDIDSWRKGRDQWTSGVFKSWKDLLMTWKDMPEYEIGMYVQYEHMFDPALGPAVLERMSELFKEAGFSVAPNEDLPCIWFQTMKEEYFRLKNYWKYTPGFTKEQRDEILGAMATFQKEVADDKELATILKTYHDDMTDNTLIDIPAKE